MFMCVIFGDVCVRLGMVNNVVMSCLNNRVVMICELREEFE